jgi:hypothetical protein
MATFNVAIAIADFVADPGLTTIELPHMTTGQRKSTKKLVEEYADLRCESYGFGADRQLHLFKKCAAEVLHEDEAGREIVKSRVLTPPSVNIENTVIGDCAAPEAEPVVFRSLKRPIERGSDFASIVRISRQVEVEVGRMDQSATTQSEATSDSTKANRFLHEELQVRNTFIHFEGASADERAVQSMPHGMFKQCLLSEASLGESGYDTPTTMGCSTPTSVSEPEADFMLEPRLPLGLGALVVVEGLVKVPAFNGRSAVVQGWDETTGRYDILLVSQHGSQQAKIKEENLRVILPCP